jgi:hypothetical protein
MADFLVSTLIVDSLYADAKTREGADCRILQLDGGSPEDPLIQWQKPRHD